jgi:leader peptidase (prepilin peptidase) / N-methyltransferase
MPELIAFVAGAMIGSFLNVCIFRLPLGESIVFPASHCQACRTPIQWYDNIPILSYFILRAKCRYCRAKFSPQYLFVEILTAVLFVVFYRNFGLTAVGVIYLVLSLALLVESFIDFRHQIIPDSITLPGIVLGLILSGIFPELHGEQQIWPSLLKSLIGILVGGGSLYLVGTVAEWILKKEAMGGGDVKLLAMIGAFMGWQGVFWTVFAGSMLGAIIGIYLRWRKGQELIPFGPYLAVAAVTYLFFGHKVVVWYFGQFS